MFYRRFIGGPLWFFANLVNALQKQRRQGPTFGDACESLREL
jgi:hypothetical protein